MLSAKPPTVSKPTVPPTAQYRLTAAYATAAATLAPYAAQRQPRPRISMFTGVRHPLCPRRRSGPPLARDAFLPVCR